MTGNDVINGALRLIGVLSSGELPTAAESSDGLSGLNTMLDEKNARRLNIFTVPRLGPFNLTVGKQTYTVGTGGDINIPRPPKIDRMGIINLANPSQPLELPLAYLSLDEWANIPVKNIQSALPQKVWDDQGFPYRTLSFYCVPNVQVQCTIYAWGALGIFPDLVTDVQFPPGYAKWLRYNLAVDLAPEFGVPLSPEILMTARETQATIQDMNAPLNELSCDEALRSPGGVYNWITDSPVRR